MFSLLNLIFWRYNCLCLNAMSKDLNRKAGDIIVVFWSSDASADFTCCGGDKDGTLRREGPFDLVAMRGSIGENADFFRKVKDKLDDAYKSHCARKRLSLY